MYECMDGWMGGRRKGEVELLVGSVARYVIV